MKKRSEKNHATNLDWVDSLSFEELAKIKEAVSDKMDSLRDSMRDKLKAEITSQLGVYGFSFEDLGFDGRKMRKAGGRAKSSGPCPICDFATDPPHDGRKHRAQGNKKKAFTASELSELGLEKA